LERLISAVSKALGESVPGASTKVRPGKTSHLYWFARALAVVLVLVAVLYSVRFFNEEKEKIPQPPITTATTSGTLEPSPKPESTPVREKPVPTSSDEEAIPEWVPTYTFAEQENKQLRRGAGSLSFETDNHPRLVQADYAAKLQAAGWKVETHYDVRGGGNLVERTSRDQRRSLAANAWREGSKTRVVVMFLDHSRTSSEESSPPEGIPNWVPIYPGKIEKIHEKGNVGGFTIITSDGGADVNALYEAILRASGYEVTTKYDVSSGWYTARATAKSQGYSIVASSIATKVVVDFASQKEQQAP
jgi:hypothetical protein